MAASVVITSSSKPLWLSLSSPSCLKKRTLGVGFMNVGAPNEEERQNVPEHAGSRMPAPRAQYLMTAARQAFDFLLPAPHACALHGLPYTAASKGHFPVLDPAIRRQATSFAPWTPLQCLATVARHAGEVVPPNTMHG